MFCGNCGKKNPDGAKFCYNCGRVLNSAPVYQAPPVQQTAPVQKKAPAKKTGAAKRILIGLIVFAVFYAGSYMVASWGNSKSDVKSSSSLSNQDSESSVKNITSVDTGFTVNAYADHWSDVRIWAWSDAKENLFEAWPGEAMYDDGNGWYSYTVPNWVDYVIINGNGGTVQTADIQVAPQDSWILVYTDNAASVTYLDPAYVKDPWANSQILEPDADNSAVSAQPVLPAQPDTGYIADLGGWWEQVHLEDGNFSLNVSALCFSETVYNCTGLTVNMDVTMNAGTSCKDWQVWGRSGNTFVKIAKIYLPAGDGYVSQSVTFRSPVTFDAIAVTPTIVGGYSWSMSLGITDVWTD